MYSPIDGTLVMISFACRNGGRRASLTFETKAKFLREKDILTESQARTACVFMDVGDVQPHRRHAGHDFVRVLHEFVLDQDILVGLDPQRRSSRLADLRDEGEVFA
jgi:hypothetical protein